MWFNILKSDERRAAYRFFRNSVIPQGELIPPKTPPPEIVGEGDLRLYSFETSNGHFKFEAEYDSVGLSQFYLSDGPPSAEPFIEYINGMFYEEYPEFYSDLKKFFTDNAPEMDFSPPSKPSGEKLFTRWLAPGIPRRFKNIRYAMRHGTPTAERVRHIHTAALRSYKKNFPVFSEDDFHNTEIQIAYRLENEGYAVTVDQFYSDFMAIWGKSPDFKIDTHRLEDIWLQVVYDLHIQGFITIEQQLINAYNEMKDNYNRGFDDLAELFS